MWADKGVVSGPRAHASVKATPWGSALSLCSEAIVLLGKVVAGTGRKGRAFVLSFMMLLTMAVGVAAAKQPIHVQNGPHNIIVRAYAVGDETYLVSCQTLWLDMYTEGYIKTDTSFWTLFEDHCGNYDELQIRIHRYTQEVTGKIGDTHIVKEIETLLKHFERVGWGATIRVNAIDNIVCEGC